MASPDIENMSQTGNSAWSWQWRVEYTSGPVVGVLLLYQYGAVWITWVDVEQSILGNYVWPNDKGLLLNIILSSITLPMERE